MHYKKRRRLLPSKLLPYLLGSAFSLALLASTNRATAQPPAESVPPNESFSAQLTEPMPAEPMPAGSEMLTIAEIASNSDTFNILTTALDAAELIDVLNSAGPYTVFAPTDEAFSTLPPEAIETLLLPENRASLVELLTYHVVPGTFLSTDLETGEIATVEGSSLAVAVDDAISVDSAQVVDADIIASNGVIHVVNRVIIPPVDTMTAE